MRVAVSVATVLLCLVCGGNDAGGGQCSYSADCCVWSVVVMKRVAVSVATVLLCLVCGGNDAGGGQCSYSTAVFGLWW